ncbi:MAG: hypothetical protein BGN88_14735 [Clostridiales bacterium 43-6]|nr:MAG: hypothetical protein BGN88_14735 [Clostridiales bacterium 43-6]
MFFQSINKMLYYNMTEETAYPITIDICPVCNKKIIAGDDLYRVGNRLFDERNCAEEFIFKIACEDDYKIYCKNYKTDFFNFVDIDTHIFYHGFYNPSNHIEKKTDFERFCSFDKSQFCNWYTMIHDIIYVNVEM